MNIKEIIKNPITIIVVVFLVIVLISSFLVPKKETGLGFTNSQGSSGVASFTSLSENTTGSYDAYQLITGALYLERILIGNSLSSGGMILSNATANNNDAIKLIDLTGLSVGSHEIGTYLNMGLMITTSPSLEATFIYTPMQ